MNNPASAAAFALCFALLSIPASPCGADGKLGKIEKKIKEGKDGKKEDKSGTKEDKSSSKESESGFSIGDTEARIIAEIAWALIKCIPYVLMPQYYFEYQVFPYRYDSGYAAYPPGEDDSPFDTGYARKSKPLAFELRSSYQLDVDGVHAVRALAKMRCTCYISFDIDVTDYFEPRGGGEWDELRFLKADLDFNVITTPHLDLDLGLGYAYVHGLGIYGGANAKITGDIFPRKPWGIHFAAGYSVFGSATISETEFALGLFFNHTEIRAGYRAIWIDDVAVHGPFMEIAFWF